MYDGTISILLPITMHETKVAERIIEKFCNVAFDTNDRWNIP